MGHVHYVKDLPKKVHLSRPPAYKPDQPDAGRTVLIDRATWDALGTYDTSTPTSPSAGRIYRRREQTVAKGADGEPMLVLAEDRGWVFFVINDPTDPKYQLHVPYKAVVV